jgi:hypothetical protein
MDGMDVIMTKKVLSIKEQIEQAATESSVIVTERNKPNINLFARAVIKMTNEK